MGRPSDKPMSPSHDAGHNGLGKRLRAFFVEAAGHAMVKTDTSGRVR